jgi:predicted nucleic acid-binding Zn ribbon protein
MRGVKLPSGGCAFCGKIIKTQKLWCNIDCQVKWEKNQQAFAQLRVLNAAWKKFLAYEI